MPFQLHPISVSYSDSNSTWKSCSTRPIQGAIRSQLEVESLIHTSTSITTTLHSSSILWPPLTIVPVDPQRKSAGQTTGLWIVSTAHWNWPCSIHPSDHVDSSCSPRLRYVTGYALWWGTKANISPSRNFLFLENQLRPKRNKMFNRRSSPICLSLQLQSRNCIHFFVCLVIASAYYDAMCV